jgi:BioD-like phosphotransacetylase family protein
VIAVQQTSYQTAAEINNIVVRISPTDVERIQTIVEQVAVNVRADEILALLGDKR